MSVRIPGMLPPLLLLAWLAQMRLASNFPSEHYERERRVTGWGGWACLAAAAGIAAMKFF